MERIISNDEIKLLLGITGSAKDALIDLLNDIQTENLGAILNVADLVTHSITEERVKSFSCEYLALSEFPVDVSQTITIKDTWRDIDTIFSGATFYLDPKERRSIRAKESDGTPIFFEKGWDYLVSYTAGYRNKVTIKILNNAGLEGETFTVKLAGTETTYTFKASPTATTDIQIGADANATAANIAAKFTGGSSSADTATLPVGYLYSRTSLSASIITITESNVPEQLKMAVAYMVGGALSEKERRGGIKEYELMNKRVVFRDESEGKMVQNIINNWASYFKKFDC